MGYGIVSRLFHWLTVLIVLVMIPVGLTMVQDIPKATQDRLFVLHKGLGSVFLIVIILRIAWRICVPPPPLPTAIPAAQRTAATIVHLGLYALLLVMAVSGYVRVTTGGFPIEWLRALGVPPLLPKNDDISKLAATVHAIGKSLLIVLIAVHVSAAAFHGMRRDGILSRMWPPIPS